MDSVSTLVLFALLTAFVGDAAASCRKIANEDMQEYSCEGGHPADLITVPETTEKLRIMRMPLRRITADTFSRFGANLLVLSCSHCEITDIDADAFRRLVNLQQLSLDSNRLTTIRASWFEGLDYLTYLDFTYNDIRDIEDGVYKNLLGLVDLRISGNRLRCLNLDEMLHLRELKRIFLSENSDFACPHAVSRFLENRGVDFQQDPEWRRIASDTIDVHVPPTNYVEEDRETVPAHRERLHPDRRPPPEESEGLYPTRDKSIYPDHSERHRSRHRRPPTTTVRPTTAKQPLPRVEPIFSDRSSHVPSESSSHQVMTYPSSTPETPREPPSEDIKMSGIDGPSRMEHTYPPHPTHETSPYWSHPTHETSPYWSHPTHETSPYWPHPTPHPTYETTTYWSHSTPERARIPSVMPISEDTRIAETDRPPQTERMLTSPPYIPTHETMPYPTSERSRVSVGSSEDETVGESGRSQAGNTVTYPLYVTTSDGIERMPHGSIQVTYPSPGIYWATDDSIEHSVDTSWMHERQEQSRRPAEENYRMTSSTRMPYYRHDPRKMIVEESSSETDDDFSVATDHPVEYDRSQTTTASGIYYVRPSPPELMHSPSTDEFYQGPYHEPTVTVHPPLQNYQDGNGMTVIRPMTDKPLPECPENSAPRTSPAALVTFIVVTVLGHIVVERF